MVSNIGNHVTTLRTAAISKRVPGRASQLKHAILLVVVTALRRMPSVFCAFVGDA